MLRKYSVMVQGDNVLLDRGQLTRMGFFTTRWIEANDEQQARKVALELVKQELEALQILRNLPGDPPKFTVEKTNEVDSFGEFITPGKGFTFFPEDR